MIANLGFKKSLKKSPDIICFPEMFLYTAENKMGEAEDLNLETLKKFIRAFPVLK